MDKLEKALEKARQQRKQTMPDFVVARGFASGQDTTSVIPPDSASNSSVVVDEVHLEKRRILANRTKSKEADLFRILRTQVLQIMNDNGYKTLAITSPNYGDGKTTVALNLAVSIALDMKQTVLLVDVDLRKPNLHDFLGLTPTVGLSDYLVNNVPLEDCIIRLPFDRLTALQGGKPVENSSEILGSPKMAALAHELKSRYHDRVIIYDMPPVLAQDDSIAFLPHVDAVLMVVRDRVTSTQELKESFARLSKANVIGTVLNNSTDPVTVGGKENIVDIWIEKTQNRLNHFLDLFEDKIRAGHYHEKIRNSSHWLTKQKNKTLSKVAKKLK